MFQIGGPRQGHDSSATLMGLKKKSGRPKKVAGDSPSRAGAAARCRAFTRTSPSGPPGGRWYFDLGTGRSSSARNIEGPT